MDKHNTLLTWYPITESPEEKWRILVFSPCYEKGHAMRIRIIEGQFLKYCSDVEYWAYPHEPRGSWPVARMAESVIIWMWIDYPQQYRPKKGRESFDRGSATFFLFLPALPASPRPTNQSSFFMPAICGVTTKRYWVVRLYQSKSKKLDHSKAQSVNKKGAREIGKKLGLNAVSTKQCRAKAWRPDPAQLVLASGINGGDKQH